MERFLSKKYKRIDKVKETEARLLEKGELFC